MVHILILLTGQKIKQKINAEDEDDGCFPYAATVALNYEELMWNP